MMNEDISIVFLGYAVESGIAETLSGVSVAGNKMQLSLLSHLNAKNVNVFATTVYPVASFPRDNKLYYKKKTIDIVGDVSGTRVGFVNIPIIKQICQIINNYLEIKRIVKKHPEVKLFTYNMYPQIGLPAFWVKRKYGNEIVCLLADLPIDDDYQRRGIDKFFRTRFNNLTKRLIKQIDKAVVLNKHAWEVYCPNAKYMVMEGGIEVSDSSEESDSPYNPKRKNLLYGGSLNEYSGVKELIDAVLLINDKDIELDIYGDGHLKQYVIDSCNDKIHYFGKIQNRELIIKQHEAWILVNPRPVEDEIAKVTFPSKVLEYMYSGTPVITTRLNGFTDEYDDLCIFSETNKPDDLKETIERACKYENDELEDIGRSAKEFIKKCKNWSVQSNRIIDFINGN